NNPTDSLPSASQVKAKVLGDIKELNQNLETIKQTETDKLRFELSNTKKLQTRKTELETQKHNIENDIKSLESELKMTSSNITDLQKEVVDLQGQVLNEKALSKVKDEIKTIIVTNLKDFLGNIKINELAEIFDDIESLFDSPITLERLKTSLFEKLDNIQSKLADYKNKKMAVNDEITGKWASLCDEATQLTVDKHSSPERNLKKIDTTLYQLDNEMHQMVLMNGNNQVEVSKLQKYLIKIRSSKQRLIDEHNLIQDELNDANRTRNNLQRKFFNRYLKSPLQAFRKKYTDEQCQYLTPLNNALENLKKTKLAEARQNIMSSSSTGFELNYYFTNLINFSPKFNTVLKSLVKDKTIPSTTKGMDELLESLKQQGGITDGEHKQAMKLIRNCRVRDDINLVPIQKLTFMFYFLFKCCDDTLLQQSFTNDDLLAAQEMVKKEFENLEQQEVEAIRRLKELEGTNDRYEELEIYKQELLKSKAHYEQSIENQRKTFAQIEELKTQSAQAEKEAEMFKNIWMKFRGQTGVNTRLKEDIDSKIQLKNEKIKESITNFENKGRELIFKAEKYKELTESIQRKKEEEENATYLITELTDLITRNTEDFNQKLSSIAQQTVNDCIKEQLANMMDSNDNTINEVLQIFLEIYSEEFIRAKDTNFVEDPNALFKFEQIEFDDISIKWPTLNPNAMTLFDDEKLAESAPDILKNLCRLMNIQNSLQVEDGSSMFCLTEKSALIKAKSELFKKLIENNALNLTGINLANYLKKYDIQDQALQITLNKVITNALKKQIVDQELDFEALVKEMDKYLKQRTRDDIRKTVTTEQTNKLILNSKNSMVGSSTNNPTHQLTECIPCTPFGPPPVHMIRSEVHN
ncbi:MAG: hypothetical protein VW397_02245, partial [Candidatus Margulisiibacteriota bacterium]